MFSPSRGIRYTGPPSPDDGDGSDETTREPVSRDRSEPGSTPIDAEPADSEPIDAEPADSEPVDADATDSGSGHESTPEPSVDDTAPVVSRANWTGTLPADD